MASLRSDGMLNKRMANISPFPNSTGFQDEIRNPYLFLRVHTLEPTDTSCFAAFPSTFAADATHLLLGAILKVSWIRVVESAEI